jgi:hypothetical protein
MNPYSIVGHDNEKQGQSCSHELPHTSRRPGTHRPTFLNKNRSVLVILTLVTSVALFSKPTPSWAYEDAPRQPSLSEIVRGGEFSSFGSKGDQKFSRVRCRTSSSEETQCVFSNIAIRSGSIIFYEDPGNPVDFITDRVRHEFPEDDFVGIRAGKLSSKDRDYYKVVKVKEAIPSSAVYLDSDVNVLMTPHYPDNIGHFIGEVIFTEPNFRRIWFRRCF